MAERLWWKIAAISMVASMAGRAQPTTSSALTLGVHFVVPCDLNRASVSMRLRGSSKRYCLERSAIINQTDVASAAFDEHAYDKSSVLLTLHNDSAERLREITGKSIGLEISVVLNRELVCVATIQARIGQIWVNGLPREEADAVIEAFKFGKVAKTAPPTLPPGESNRTEYNAGSQSRVGNGVSGPVLIKKREPEYTARARAAKIQGVVLLDAVILPDGTPDDIHVSRSLDPELDAKAIECVRAWRFRPALRDGKPTSVRTTLEVSFHL